MGTFHKFIATQKLIKKIVQKMLEQLLLMKWSEIT